MYGWGHKLVEYSIDVIISNGTQDVMLFGKVSAPRFYTNQKIEVFLSLLFKSFDFIDIPNILTIIMKDRSPYSFNRNNFNSSDVFPGTVLYLMIECQIFIFHC